MKLPFHVTDATLRDGLEDFVLKRMYPEEISRLGTLLDRVGFYSIDCWGGSTFYHALTALVEDPWERLKRLRRAIRQTPLQMVVRGQMLVGFKPYQKELVRKFLAKAANLGIDIFRIYDQLNDLANMRPAIVIAKELRKEVEATVLYSRSPNVTQADYLRLAEDLINVGADSICINDSLGTMTPEEVASLVTTYKWNFHQPLRLHLHDSQRKAVASYLVGVQAGAERVDTIMGPLVWSDCPPAAEELMAALAGTSFAPRLDQAALAAVSDYLKELKVAHRYQEPVRRKAEATGAEGYLPGLLKDYLREELRSRQARDRLQAALKEAHRVWQDLGFPPLKGRILEIVGDQALANLFAAQRYEKLTDDMQDLIRGRYGSLYSITDETLRQIALRLREQERSQPWEGRLRQPPGITREEDILTYSLFPDEAVYFLQQRDKKAAAAPAVKPAPPKTPTVPASRLAQGIPRGLSLTLKGEEVAARLEAIGPLRGNKQTLFINIGDMTEEIEVSFVDAGGARPEYLVTFHGETHRLQIKKVFPKEEEYTPIFLEIDDKTEEFLIKHQHID
ncbi:MAG: hypothetical protein ACUVRZ_06690 [Desulfobacca sp.]|uniref:hypothetical protein n=1 Tax=Desulfobacca sp. TaxID=2067990 RepID=UPI00404ABCEB